MTSTGPDERDISRVLCPKCCRMKPREFGTIMVPPDSSAWGMTAFIAACDSCVMKIRQMLSPRIFTEPECAQVPWVVTVRVHKSTLEGVEPGSVVDTSMPSRREVPVWFKVGDEVLIEDNDGRSALGVLLEESYLSFHAKGYRLRISRLLGHTVDDRHDRQRHLARLSDELLERRQEELESRRDRARKIIRCKRPVPLIPLMCSTNISKEDGEG